MMNEEIHINKLLLPFSFLYGIIIWFRNKFFDWGILKSEEFPIPVISVGNITVGGTGKTPHIEYLINILKDEFRIAVLSRGYKRKTSGFILAEKGMTGKHLGDEPYQIWKKYPDILVAVDKKRRRGIHNLLSLPENEQPEIILLDDAFQHRYVTPSLSILLMDSHRPIYEDCLLPAGRLRESVSNKSRANMVIVTKCPLEFTPIDYRIVTKHLNLYPHQTLFFSSWMYGSLKPVFNEINLEELTWKELKKQNTQVFLLAGIANPTQFEEEISKNITVVERMFYPDHHPFSANDISKIEKKYTNIPGENKIIITTEKDAARLSTHNDLCEFVKKKLYYQPIEVVINLNQADIFKQKIVEHVRTIKRNRFLD